MFGLKVNKYLINIVFFCFFYSLSIAERRHILVEIFHLHRHVNTSRGFQVIDFITKSCKRAKFACNVLAHVNKILFCICPNMYGM